MLEALRALLVCAAAGALGTFVVPDPSADLLNGLASLGTGLLLAYVVEISWLTGRIRSVSDYERRLGSFVGIGAGGLLGVVVALLLAAHRNAGHSNLLDSVGLAWVAASLAFLGGLVIAQPLLVHEWSNSQPDSD
ncbi:MAG: hypothetical protein ACJ75S_08545 [Solirubrobacterales bacterium]